MRVVLLTADYPPCAWSGIGAAVADQAHALGDLGIEVEVLAPVERSLPVRTAEPRVHSLWETPCPVEPRGIDIIHLHSLALGELALELRRRSGAALIYTVHSLVDLEMANWSGAAFWSGVQRCLLAASDHILFLSAAEHAAGLERLPEIAGRSSILPMGVPEPPPARPVDDGGPVVFAGRFARSKGIDLLVEIVPRVLLRWEACFVLAGGHGDARESRRVQALSRGFGARCSAPGWLGREALEELFAQSGLVVVPSRYEPFGRVALEAMRVGAPVLAAAVGGLIEVVADGSGGRLIGSRDPDHWSERIVAMVADGEHTRELRRRGPEYVSRHFNRTQLAERLIREVYRTYD